MSEWLQHNVTSETIILILGSIWYYFKGHKEGLKLDTLPELLMGEFRQHYVAFMSDPAKRALAQAKFEELAWSLLTRTRLPRNSTTEAIVKSAVTKAISEIDREVANREHLQSTLNDMVARAVESLKSLEPSAEAKARQPLGDVTLIGADGGP